MPRTPLTYGQLHNQTGTPGPRPFLYCPRCHEQYSANAGDYFAVDPAAPITCANGHRTTPMRLMRREVRFIEVKGGK